ncbi:unnamed protein product [Trichogramma brassicae]|uniref:Uncharacterized protein n=1 Tax=Trichogramma brassicae TaxID=86971 RepID=A0A6H5I0Y5_9HYME|nr:unnamed protein product [Trichogramma brassicae]
MAFYKKREPNTRSTADPMIVTLTDASECATHEYKGGQSSMVCQGGPIDNARSGNTKHSCTFYCK